MEEIEFKYTKRGTLLRYLIFPTTIIVTLCFLFSRFVLTLLGLYNNALSVISFLGIIFLIIPLFFMMMFLFYLINKHLPKKVGKAIFDFDNVTFVFKHKKRKIKFSEIKSVSIIHGNNPMTFFIIKGKSHKLIKFELFNIGFSKIVEYEKIKELIDSKLDNKIQNSLKY